MARKTEPKTYVGISGWTYPGWRRVFYPEGLAHRRELEYASRTMDSIEINGSFYSLQRPTSYAKWHDETPPGFVFAVKGSRFITHMLKLRKLETALPNFFASGVLRLGRKLPPSYRDFLAFSDGWTNFFNGASLLGTGDLGRTGQLDANHGRLLQRGRLLPFGADRTGASLFAFDTSMRLGDGELSVVAWVGGLGIDCRCFTSFLATVLQLCRAELSTVKAVDPPAQAATSSTAAGARGWLDVG